MVIVLARSPQYILCISVLLCILLMAWRDRTCLIGFLAGATPDVVGAGYAECCAYSEDRSRGDLAGGQVAFRYSRYRDYASWASWCGCFFGTSQATPVPR